MNAIIISLFLSWMYFLSHTHTHTCSHTVSFPPLHSLPVMNYSIFHWLYFSNTNMFLSYMELYCSPTSHTCSYPQPYVPPPHLSQVFVPTTLLFPLPTSHRCSYTQPYCPIAPPLTGVHVYLLFRHPHRWTYNLTISNPLIGVYAIFPLLDIR